MAEISDFFHTRFWKGKKGEGGAIRACSLLPMTRYLSSKHEKKDSRALLLNPCMLIVYFVRGGETRALTISHEVAKFSVLFMLFFL